jgi:hypothetical protein
MFNPWQQTQVKTEMTEKQKRLAKLVEKLAEHMPPMVQGLAKTYINSFLQLDDEAIDRFIEEVEAMIRYVKDGEAYDDDHTQIG